MTNILLFIILAGGWGVFFYLLFRYFKPKAPAGNNPVVTHTGTQVALHTLSEIQQSSVDGVLLSIEVPKDNETTPLAAELMFASLHGIYRPELDKNKVNGQDSISFELQAQEKAIRFFVWVPKYLQGYVEGQIYAQYQGVNIQEVKDYASPSKIDPKSWVAASELTLIREDIFPIKSFDSFEVDPLSAITSTLSKLEGLSQVWVQILVKPESDSWRNRAISYITSIRSGQKDFATSLMKGLTGLASDVMTTALGGGNTAKPAGESKVELAPGVEDALKKIEDKSTKLGFQTKIRIVAIDKDPANAQQKLDLVVGSFKQFNTTNLNGFTAVSLNSTTQVALDQYSKRTFTGKGPVLNVTELASIYHLPSKAVITPHIVWAGSKKGEPPANLPLAEDVPATELTNLGVTNFRGSQEVFGIKIKDRRRHIYVIGKSGVGKSTLLQNMTLDDIKEGRGVGVVDPHGEYVDYVLERIPENRIDDVILFDPSDKDFPIGFNVLEVENPKYKVITASGVVSVFKKIFAESWGPRLEYWLSSAILALLDYPGATLMMVPQLFTDAAFRAEVIEKIQDPLIKARWINEYNKLDQKQQSETISPILNKVGQFLSSNLVRNIVGQPKSAFKLREAMDSRKILLVKLSKGLIGEDNAALLGAMLVTKIQLAAMSRADEPDVAKRADFFLYVDEFQNFATDSFATILSEARKYNLSLTVANQYMAQLPDAVKDAIIGNVGTIISFRVGGDDAAVLIREFAPVFDEQDLVNLNVFNVYMKLSIDGLTAGAFSATTLPPTIEGNSNKEKVIEASRKKFSGSATNVESMIATQQASSTQSPKSSFKPQGAPAGNGGGNRAPFSRAPMPPQKKQPPKIDLLKNLITGIEKKGVVIDESAKQELEKTVKEDLGTNSFKDAFAKAQQPQPEVEPEKKPDVPPASDASALPPHP